MRPYLAVNSSKLSSSWPEPPFGPCPSLSSLRFRLVLKPLTHPIVGAPIIREGRFGATCERKNWVGCVRDTRRARLRDDIGKGWRLRREVAVIVYRGGTERHVNRQWIGGVNSCARSWPKLSLNWQKIKSRRLGAFSKCEKLLLS